MYLDQSPATISMTATQCRELAEQLKTRAREAGISEKRATILMSMARSYAGLASQLDLLASDVGEFGPSRFDWQPLSFRVLPTVGKTGAGEPSITPSALPPPPS